MNRSCRVLTFALLVALYGCTHHKPNHPTSLTPVAERLARRGDEIAIAGQLFHTNAPVVLWTDPGGFDAYRTERRFSDIKDSSYNATTQAAEDIYQRTGK